MPLQMGQSLFGERSPDVSDGGYQHIVSDGNVARRALITFTGDDLGSFNNMFDLDDSTSFASQGVAADGTEYYITFEFSEPQNNAVVTSYFAATTSGGGNTVVVTLQRSEDGTTYTDMATATQVGAGTTYKNYAEKPANMKYLRFKLVTTGGGGTNNQAQIYYFQVANG